MFLSPEEGSQETSAVYYDEIEEDELEQGEWKEFRKRFRLTAIFMNAAYNIRFRFDWVNENDPLSKNAPFPVTQITGFKIYGDNGKRLPNNNPHNAPVKKVKAIYGRIIVSYDAGSQDGINGPSFSASGFSYDYGNDYNNGAEIIQAEAILALRERAKAALILAYKAKAAGWEEVNFGRTQDQVERCMLYWACKHVDLKIAPGEKVDKSAIPSVEISNLPGDTHPLVKDLERKGINQDNSHPFLIVVKTYFDQFVESPNDYYSNAEWGHKPQSPSDSHRERELTNMFD